MVTAKDIKDYSVYIVNAKKKLIELERDCLHGVVKDDAATYKAIRDGISDVIRDLTGLYDWAAGAHSKAYATNSARSVK